MNFNQTLKSKVIVDMLYAKSKIEHIKTINTKTVCQAAKMGQDIPEPLSVLCELTEELDGYICDTLMSLNGVCFSDTPKKYTLISQLLEEININGIERTSSEIIAATLATEQELIDIEEEQ